MTSIYSIIYLVYDQYMISCTAYVLAEKGVERVHRAFCSYCFLRWPDERSDWPFAVAVIVFVVAAR